jgi:hypothetical protein
VNNRFKRRILYSKGVVVIKKFVVINATYIAEIDETILNNHGDDSIWEHFDDDFPLCIVPYTTLEAEHESSSMVVLEPSTMNCFRCYKCNRWITNKDRFDYIESLMKSYIINDKMYCPECFELEK